MRFLSLAFLAGLTAAGPVAGSCTGPACVIPGFNGIVGTVDTTGYKDIFNGVNDPEACRQLCYSPEYAYCKSFGIRYSGEGACRLWDYQVAPRGLKPGEAVSTYVYYNTPEGVQGWVPENVAQHYYADVSKKKGDYTSCRELCLSDPRCKAFGFKPLGNCQLYAESLIGKVSETTESPYIQYEADCVAASYTLATYIPKPTV